MTFREAFGGSAKPVMNLEPVPVNAAGHIWNPQLFFTVNTAEFPPAKDKNIN